MKQLFKHTRLWEKMRDKWVFEVMVTGKSPYPKWVVWFLF